MAVFKRGKNYSYHFYFNGQHVQKSTKQGNPRVARQMEAAHRTALAKGEVGIVERGPVRTLAEFMKDEFMPWVEATFKKKPNTYVWYRGGCRRLSEFKSLAGTRMDQITGEEISAFVAHRQRKGLGITALNRELQILRRILNVAKEWGRITQSPKVRMLPGEHRRERVITLDEETRYLAFTDDLLQSVTTVLLDTGMRPEECFRLRWEHVSFENGRYGSILVPHGKTRASRRMLPMSPRVRDVLESRWLECGQPEEGHVFPSRTRSGHIEPSTLRNSHRKALQASRVRPFVLYDLRHTFLTRLGASGCDVWTLAKIAGHSSLIISARYVHPDENKVLAAMSQLQTRTAPRQLRQ